MHLPWFQAAPADYVERMQGTDRDLAAHFTIINHYGIPLYGREIPEVFGPVPEAAYFDSIWHDVQDAGQEIGEDTVYVVLNLCRVLAFAQDGLILSKAAGGNWGLTHLPREFHDLIQQALACYQSGRAIPPDAPIQGRFASAMLSAIRREAQARRLCDGAAAPLVDGTPTSPHTLFPPGT